LVKALRRGLNPLDPKGNYSATSNNTKSVHWPLMSGLLHLVQRGGPWRATATPRPLLAVPNITAGPPTASAQTSYYLMWDYNCLWTLKGWSMLLSIAVVACTVLWPSAGEAGLSSPQLGLSVRCVINHNQDLLIANRSRVSCAHKVTRTTLGIERIYLRQRSFDASKV